MKVFVAVATGALGRQLVPRLVANGHAVTGMTRSASKQDALREWGARPVVPDAIVHELTALSGSLDLRRFDRSFAATNRLRTAGTDHLLAAGRAAGVRR